MKKEIKRCLKIGDWVFEVKAIRALKVDNYGEPYRAIANISLNGDTAYIDGVMTKTSADFASLDIQKLSDACRMFEIKDINIDDSVFLQMNEQVLSIQA